MNESPNKVTHLPEKGKKGISDDDSDELDIQNESDDDVKRPAKIVKGKMNYAKKPKKNITSDSSEDSLCTSDEEVMMVAKEENGKHKKVKKYNLVSCLCYN